MASRTTRRRALAPGSSDRRRPADHLPKPWKRPVSRGVAAHRDRVILAGFLVAAMTGVLILVGVFGSRYYDNDLRTAITVNGVTISRGDLRGRIALNQALTDARLAHLRTAVSAGIVTADQESTIRAEIESTNADPISKAIDGLIDDQLIVAGADQASLKPEVDVEAEIARFTAADLGRELEWLTIVDPSKPGAGSLGAPAPAPETASEADRADHRTKATAWASQSLLSGASLESVSSDLRTAGWTVATGSSWIRDDGPALGLPDDLLVAARDPAVKPGDVLGPFVDPVHGTGATARIVRLGDPTDVAAWSVVGAASVDSGATRRWATARAAERALRVSLLGSWRSTPQPQVRASELVIGPGDVQGRSGSFVSFAHLVVDQLPTDPNAGQDRPVAIASELQGLDRQARETMFQQLVDEANQTPTGDPLRRSGELGYFTKDELVPALATDAFRVDVVDGQVIGPIQTEAGPELFMVRGRFEGSLDERSDAELVESRTSTDLSALATRISPVGDRGRAGSGPWRTEAELAGNDGAREALLTTPIGVLSDPFELDGQIVVARPLERRTAPVAPDSANRLAVLGWSMWLARARAEAAIVVDPEPLPGIQATAPSASIAPSADLAGPPNAPGPTESTSTSHPGLPTFQVAP